MTRELHSAMNKHDAEKWFVPSCSLVVNRHIRRGAHLATKLIRKAIILYLGSSPRGDTTYCLETHRHAKSTLAIARRAAQCSNWRKTIWGEYTKLVIEEPGTLPKQNSNLLVMIWLISSGVCW